MKNYVSLQEIMEIYSISQHTAGEILKKYRIESHKHEDGVYIKFSEFHQIYTTEINPPLFPTETKKIENPSAIKDDNYNILSELFSEPMHCKMKKFKRANVVMQKK